MNSPCLRRVLVGSVFALSLSQLPSQALVVTWNGAGAASAWLTPANWSPAQIPASNDVVVFTTVGTSQTIDLNMGAIAGGTTQRVGMIQLASGTNRIIQNSSLSSNGFIQLNGSGSGMVLSNGTTSAGLHFRNSGTTNPVLTRLVLNTDGDVFVNSGALVTVSNVVIAEMGGVRSLTKSGGGTLTLGATNLYSGGTVIVSGPNSQTAGAINLLSLQALGGGTVTLSNTASLTPLYFTATAAGAGTLSNNIVLSPTVGITNRLVANNSVTQIATLSGVISGGDAGQTLQIDGDAAGAAGRIRLSNAANSFRVGYINLVRGGLVFDSDGALGDAVNTLRLDEGSLVATTGLIFGDNVTLPTNRTIFINSMTRIDSQSFTGTVQAVITNNAALRKGGTGDLVLNGVVSGTGGFTVDAGTLVLNATNTLTGGHTNAATLALGVDGALGSGTLDLRGAAGVTRSADANPRAIGNNLNIATDTSFGAPGTGDLTFNGATANNGGGAKKLTVLNNLTTINNNFNNTGPVTKFGSGQLVLGAANTLSGPLTIAEGPLALGASAGLAKVPVITVSNGASFDVSAPGSFTVGVSTNQILQGYGIVTGSLVVSDSAQLHPGVYGDAGTLTVTGTVIFSSGTTNTFDLTNAVTAGVGNDLLVVQGDFEPLGSRIRINPLLPLVSGSYRLIDYSGSKGSSFTGPVLGNTTRSTWTLDEGTANQINLLVAATNALLVWTANNSSDWDLATTNWTISGGAVTTAFFDNDVVLFDDTGANSNVINIATTVRPLGLTVDTTSNYTFSGSGTVADPVGTPLLLVKSGTGTLVIQNTLSNTAGVVVSNGVLQVGAGGSSGLLGPGLLTAVGSGTLAFFRSNNAFAVNNALAGDGTLLFRGTGATLESGYSLAGINTNFTGAMVVTNARVIVDSANDLGAAGATIVVQDGGSIYQSAGTFGRPVSIKGIGWSETAGRLGALRVENATWNAPVTLAGDARIVAYSANGTITGTIGSPYELELWDGSTTARAMTLTPASPNTYGSLRVSSNIVVIAGNANAFGTGPVIMNGGTQRLAGFSFAISNLSSTTAGGTITCGASTPSTLTIGLDDSSTIYSGIFANPVGVTGTMNVNKVGAGTLTLAGVNLNTGTFTVQAGAIALSAGGSISNAATVVLDGGNFDVVAKGGYAPGHVIRGNGSVSGTVHLAVANTLVPETGNLPGTISIGGNLDMTPGYALVLDLTNSTVTGSGINDLISVNGNLEPSNSVISINPLAPLATGTNTLLTYTGTKLSAFNPAVLGNVTRKTWTLDETTSPGRVDLVVAGDYATLNWLPQAGGNGLWDQGTTNWFNTGTLATDRFYQADAVVFDDAGAYSNGVTLSGTLLPGSVTVNSSSNYSLAGAGGRISGNAGIVKSGSGRLTIATSNDYSGTVSVNEGILAVGNPGALGSLVGETVVSNGTLDLQSVALKLSRERLQIIGTGVNSTGAVISTGGSQADAIGFISLIGNASVGAWPVANRWDIRGPAGTGSGEVNLNGFTMSKVGPGRVSLIDSIVTNAGSIVVQEGMFEVSRNMMSGDGSFSLTPNTSLLFENYSAGAFTKLLTMDGAAVSNIGNAFTLGSPVILSNANVFSTSLNLTITNVISGPGQLRKITAGMLVLTCANTYEGGTSLAGGNVTIGSDSSLGSGDVTVTSIAELWTMNGPRLLTNNVQVSNVELGFRTTGNDLTITGPISATGLGDLDDLSGTVIFATNTVNVGRTIYVHDAGRMIMDGATVAVTNDTLRWENSTAGTLSEMVITNGANVQVYGTNGSVNARLGNSDVAAAGIATQILYMASGSLNFGPIHQRMILGGANKCAGVVNQDGGVISFENTSLGGLRVGDDKAGASGIYNLSGGTAAVAFVERAGSSATSTGVFNFAGGILRAIASSTTFMTNLTVANVLSGGAIIDTANFHITIAQALLTGGEGNDGGLTKLGGGTLSLNAANTYTGATIVSAGYLCGTGSVAGAVTVNSGAAIGQTYYSTVTGTFTVGSSLMISNGGLLSAYLLGTNPAIRVAGDFNISPTTTVQLIAPSTVTNGTYVLVDYGGVFNGSISDFNLLAIPYGSQGYLTNNLTGTSIDLVVTNAGTGIKWNGLVDATWKNIGPLNWLTVPGGSATAYSPLDAVLFDDTAAGTTTLNLTEVVSPSSIIVSNETKDYVWSGGGISGSGGLVKQGAAELTITGNALSYTNTTTVLGGTLKLDSLTALNSSIANSSTVELSSASGLWVAGSNRTFSGGVFKKTGAGTVSIWNGTFSGSSLFTIEAGTLRNDGNGSVWANNSADLYVEAGATFDMRADPVNFNILAGSGTITNGYGNTAVELLTIGVANGSWVFDGTIHDSGRIGAGLDNGSIGLLKVGTGTQTFAGVNSYMGGTILDGGTLAYTVDQPDMKGIVFGAASSSTNLSMLDLTIASMTATALTAQVNNPLPNVILIGDGKTLTISGNASLGNNSGVNKRTGLQVVGGGSLVVNGTSYLVGTATGAVNYDIVTNDMSQLGSFLANLGAGGTFRVGNSSSASLGTIDDTVVMLASNSMITAGTVGLGDVSGQGGLNGTLWLGSQSNVINANTINIGLVNGNRSSGQMLFYGPTGKLVVRGSSGGSSRATMNVLKHTSATGTDTTGLLDTTGHEVDMLLSTLTIDSRTGNSAVNDHGTVLFNSGTLDATSVIISRRSSTTTGGTSFGLFSIGGGNVIVGAGGISMANSTVAGSTANATLNMTGGVITVGGDITRVGGAGTTVATVLLDGASLDMQGNVIGGATPINNLNLQSGTLANVGEVNSGAAWSKSTAGTLVLNGTNLFTSAITIDGGVLLVNGSKSGTGNVTVNAGTLGGNGFVAGTVLNVGGSIAPGTSIGRLTALGDVLCANALDIELAGTTPATGHDQLVVVGSASIAGALNVTTNNAFVPTAGNTFTVLVAGVVSGTFATTNLPTLNDPNMGWDVTYLADAVVLSVTGAPPAATGYDLAALSITNGLTGYQDDADSDGYANLLEYVTGGDLTNADTIARMNGTRVGGLLALQFTRTSNSVDTTLIVEGANSSTNGANWIGIATNIGGSWGSSTNIVETNGPAIMNVTAFDTSPATNRFLRLRITRP